MQFQVGLSETCMNIENLGYIEVNAQSYVEQVMDMSIVIEAVSEEDFLAWAMDIKIRYAMSEKIHLLRQILNRSKNDMKRLLIIT